MRILLSIALLLLVAFTAHASDEDAVSRGKKALTERNFLPPVFSPKAYDNVWKQWGVKEAPKDYDAAFRDYYGLHPAPYPNGKYPMGLREGKGLLGKGLTTDCMVCHGGAIMGKSYIGLPNTTFDYHALLQDMAATDRIPIGMPFQFTTVRGTSEAGAMSVYLLSLREPDLKLTAKPLDLGLRDDLCEDAPAWWLLKRKRTMYHHGGMDARSVRSLMQFMLTPLNGRASFEKEEPTFRDIQAYLLSLEAPKYPLDIDKKLVAQGEKLFTANCAKCHGTYGDKPTYPNKIIPLEEIGTDPLRYHGISKKFSDHYNASWFGDEKKGTETGGYQAPPLDGIWATAPYFHNGSVPTIYHVLNSKARPTIFTRSYRTEKEDYDAEKVGWKVTTLEKSADPKLPAIERRKVYDTRQPGRNNTGHTYGDKLTEEERRALIEYLKTL